MIGHATQWSAYVESKNNTRQKVKITRGKKTAFSPNISIEGILTEAIELLRFEAEQLSVDENGMIIGGTEAERREKNLFDVSIKLEGLRTAMKELGLH